jgi:hypothetical protein
MTKLISELKYKRAYYEKCASEATDFSVQDMYFSKIESILVQLRDIK